MTTARRLHHSYADFLRALDASYDGLGLEPGT